MRGCYLVQESHADITGVTFKYDPLGRRIYKSVSTGGTSVFAYDGDNLVEEANTSGAVVARYTQTQNIDEPLAMLRSSTTSYYNADGLGTVTSLANGSGTLTQSYTYDSFGKQTASSGSLVNPFQYTGRESDSETGLDYYRARYYDQSVGRFISEDPIGFGADGTNFYRYGQNNPIDLSDSQGTCPQCGGSGKALPPSYFQNLGRSSNLIDNALNLISFRHGAMLDAQAYGADPAYANYVFGVYMASAGYTLYQTLDTANTYAAFPASKSKFPFIGKKYPKLRPTDFDPNWGNTPAINFANIIAGFNDARNGTLRCTTTTQ